MESIVQDHERRIIELEKTYSEVQREMMVVQTSQAKIENILYRQSTEQKEQIDAHQKEQKELTNTLIHHVLGIRSDSNKKKWEMWIGLLGGGSILYVIFEYLAK